MLNRSLDQFKYWTKRAAIASTVFVVIISVLGVLLWRDRASLDEIDWQPRLVSDRFHMLEFLDPLIAQRDPQ